jgi:hypothetical protein
LEISPEIIQDEIEYVFDKNGVIPDDLEEFSEYACEELIKKFWEDFELVVLKLYDKYERKNGCKK